MILENSARQNRLKLPVMVVLRGGGGEKGGGGRLGPVHEYADFLTRKMKNGVCFSTI